MRSSYNTEKIKLTIKNAWLPVLVFTILISAFIYIAYSILTMVGIDIVMTYTDELASHDTQKIREFVKDRWTGLDSFYKDLRARDFDSVAEIMNELNIKTYSREYDHLYIIDEDGNLYTESYNIYSAQDNVFNGFFHEGEKNFVALYDDKGKYCNKLKEHMLYGLDMSEAPIVCGDKRFVKLILMNDITKIRERLKVTSFDGRGYSSIIDETGRYIVTDTEISGHTHSQNFYELIDTGYVRDHEEQKVVEKVKAGEPVQFWYTSTTGVEKFISVYPIGNSDWNLITALEKTVVTGQINVFVRVVIVIICFLLLIIIVVYFSVWLTKRKLEDIYGGVIEGVYNRQYHNDKLINENVKALAIMDLDKLKKINDSFGHIAGDRAIEKMAHTLVSNINPDSTDVFRFGGDEFVIAFKEYVPADSFRRILENIIDDIREASFEEYPGLKLTLSIGGYHGEGTAGELLLKADELLYRAKKQRDTLVTNV